MDGLQGGPNEWRIQNPSLHHRAGVSGWKGRTDGGLAKPRAKVQGGGKRHTGTFYSGRICSCRALAIACVRLETPSFA